MRGDGSALAAVLRRVDEINAGDPNMLTVDGVERPKELVHAEMMTKWLLRLDPEAGTEQRVAARAHHLRRWALPRAEFPEGRVGYLKWRAELSRRHAAEITAIMADEGFGPDPIARVTQIVRKQDIKGDPAVQTHEDALCLVFLSTQFEGLIADHGEAKVVEIVAKTLVKMSPSGIAHAEALDYTPTERAVLDRAIASVA